MGMTVAERQRRYRERKIKWATENLPWVQCQCGCGVTIPPLNTNLLPAKYAHGHNPTSSAFKPGRALSAETVAKIEAKRRRGDTHHRWNGGEWMVKGGYWRLTISAAEAEVMPTALRHGNGWSIPRSHHVWNTVHLDDPVLPGEVIHHIDHVRDNDVIQNLEKLTAEEHYALHLAERNPMEHGPDGRFLRRAQ